MGQLLSKLSHCVSSDPYWYYLKPSYILSFICINPFSF
jgi:hypothetical protein